MARKILLADDSVTAQNMGRKILADAGYEVITVNNGSAALKKIAEQKPDLIVLDVYMPGYSGLEVCQRLKEGGDTARIPVLLTVGKLEPFKPEEAQRVHAEAFIVKPFEASELLSALAKLEDKVVPRSEGSKPGRFGRAIAAMEESSRTAQPSGDEDGGWKNRISFPKKKKEREPEVSAPDDASVYNAVNRDLRTVVETPAEKHATHAEPDSKVDVGAVVPPGLPKDVTPEELAAIAAAAAQMQAQTAVHTPAVQNEDSATKDAPGTSTTVDAKTETPAEFKAEPIAEARPASEPPAVEAPAAATFATQDQTRDDAARDDAARDKEKTDTLPAVAATTSLVDGREPYPHAGEIKADVSTESDKPSYADSIPAALLANTSHDAIERRKAFENAEVMPATIATSAELVAASDSNEARWMAIPVTLGADEAAMSLDDEMRKAEAALTAAAAVGAVSPAPFSSAATSEVPSTSVFSSTPAFPSAPETRTHDWPEMAAADQEPAISAPTVESAAAAAPVPSDNRVTDEMAESATPLVPEASAAPAELHPEIAETKGSEPKPEELKEAELPKKEEEFKEAEPTPPALETEKAAYAFHPIQPVPEPGSFEAMKSAEQPTGHAEETAAAPEHSKDSDAATRAAAWASWRQIRDTGDARGKTADSVRLEDFKSDAAASDDRHETAAAVAAGAERILQEASAAAPGSDPKAIASIVESVLADLRPRIVEEISRKLSEGKK